MMLAMPVPHSRGVQLRWQNAGGNSLSPARAQPGSPHLHGGASHGRYAGGAGGCEMAQNEREGRFLWGFEKLSFGWREAEPNTPLAYRDLSTGLRA
jgi:hypothetical protein